MDFDIPAGSNLKVNQTVGRTDLASVYGSGLLDVFATPAMVALMENAAHHAVQPYLPEGWITVGTRVDVEHLKGTLPGREVYAHAVLESREGRRLTFRVEAFDESGLIGQGTHERFIVETDRFMKKLQDA